MFRNGLAILVLCLLAVGGVQAYHGTTYQYDVRGYVLDADEQPIAGSPVNIRAGAVGGSTTTNARGYYSMLLRLHLEDWGESLRIRTDHGEGTTVVRFPPEETSGTHVHYVNLVGGELNEEQLIDRDLIGWLYIIGAMMLAIVVVVIVLRLLRRFLPKRTRATPAADSSSARTGSSRSGSKKKRRKRS